MRDAYPTPLDEVSSDITKVGGEGAYVGMLREGADGKLFVLAQLSTGSVAAGQKLILAYDGGTAKVVAAASTSRCSGVNAGTRFTISSGYYFWMQVYGRADNVLCSGVTLGTEVGSAGAGVATSLTLVSLVTHVAASDADFTLHLTGKIGWALTAEASNLCSVMINPGYVWTGSGGPLSLDYTEDAPE